MSLIEQLARQTREEHWSHEEYLFEALSIEQLSRRDSAIRQRIHDAHFPELKTLDTFDFAATGGTIAPAQISDLARGDWLTRGDNVIFAGPIGIGKTHLAIALGIEAAKLRKRFAFLRAADLVRALLEARDARELGRMQRRMLRADLLILDELGFVPFDRAGGELLFNVVTERYERRSVLITTSLAFTEWVKVLGGDEKLLDRLAHHATVITTKGKRYRMRRRKGTLGEADAELAGEASGGSKLRCWVDQFPAGGVDQIQSGAISNMCPNSVQTRQPEWQQLEPATHRAPQRACPVGIGTTCCQPRLSRATRLRPRQGTCEACGSRSEEEGARRAHGSPTAPRAPLQHTCWIGGGQRCAAVRCPNNANARARATRQRTWSCR